MSLVAIRNGLVQTIVDHGKWAASQVSTCDFGVVEFSASAVVLAPGPATTIRPLEFRGSASARAKEIEWDIAGFVFVKDPGDATAFLANLWTACDDIFNSVNRDDSLSGAAQAAHIATISRPDPDLFYTLNGHDYGVIRFAVKATDWAE
jgi:hypothetical protein